MTVNQRARRGLLTVAASIASATALGGRASAAAYSFTTIDIPAATYSGTRVTGINNAGEVVGSYFTDAVDSVGFSKTGSTVTTFSPFEFNIAEGVNNLGQITVQESARGLTIGSAIDTAGVFAGFPVPNPGTPSLVRIGGINDLGQAVGYYTDDGGGYSGYVVDGAGHVTVLNPPGVTFLQAFGINNAGTVVGDLIDSAGSGTGFVDVNGIFAPITVQGGSSTTVTGINNAGVLTGTYFLSGVEYGFVDVGGSFTTLAVSGATQTMADGINDLGQVSGTYQDAAGLHGFVATPVTAVPEPASATLFGAGVAAMGLALARRRAANQ